MRAIVALLALFTITEAQAGGIGLILNGGMHTEPVYYYSTHDYNTQSGNPIPYESSDEYQQYETTQLLGHTGVGVEFVLGDRDDRVIGTFRVYYMEDAAQNDPTETASIQPEHVVANFRDINRGVGMGMVGISWGFLGQPGGLMAGMTAHVGSGFLTWDQDGGPLAHTEFLAFDMGPTVMYKVSRAVQLNADVVYQARFRKGFSHGPTGHVGVRYMFD